MIDTRMRAVVAVSPDIRHISAPVFGLFLPSSGVSFFCFLLLGSDHVFSSGSFQFWFLLLVPLVPSSAFSFFCLLLAFFWPSSAGLLLLAFFWPSSAGLLLAFFCWPSSGLLLPSSAFFWGRTTFSLLDPATYPNFGADKGSYMRFLTWEIASKDAEPACDSLFLSCLGPTATFNLVVSTI